MRHRRDSKRVQKESGRQKKNESMSESHIVRHLDHQALTTTAMPCIRSPHNPPGNAAHNTGTVASRCRNIITSNIFFTQEDYILQKHADLRNGVCSYALVLCHGSKDERFPRDLASKDSNLSF